MNETGLLAVRRVPMAQDTQNGPQRLLEQFLARRSEQTRRAYRADLRDFARWTETGSPAAAVAHLIAQGPGPANELALAYKSALIASGKSAATVNRRLSTLRSVLKMARTVGLCNFALEVESERQQAYRDTRGPGEDHVRELVGKLTARASQGKRQAIRDLALTRLLFNLGLRRGEAVSLDVDHYDREGQRLSVQGKGRNEREWLDLADCPRVREAVEAWLAERGDAPGPMFVRCDRLARIRGMQRLSGTSVWRMLAKHGIRPHGLRHSAITAAARVTNGNLVKVAAFSRHSNMNTVRRYVDNLEAEGGKVAGMLEAIA